MDTDEIDDLTGNADIADVEVIYSDGEDEDSEVFDDFAEGQNQIGTEIIDISKFTFARHTKSVFCSALNRTGTWAATGSEDDTAYVWDVLSGEVLFECIGHKDSVTEVCFNHNDQFIATGDMAGLIQVWSCKEKKLLWCFEGDDMEWLMWHPMANVLFCGCHSGDIYIWQIPSGNCKVLPSPSNVQTTCAKVVPNGKQLLVGYGDGHIRLWDIKEACALWTNTDSDASVTSLDISPDGVLAVTAPTAQVIKILDGRFIGSVMLDGETEIEAALFNTDLGVIITGSLSGQLCVWQLGKFTLRHQARIECAVTVVKPGSGDKVFVGATDGAVYMCDVKAGTLLDVFTGHSAEVLSISVFPNDNQVLTTSDDGTAKIFKSKSK
ncbi:angio-associated migratory cell protein [Euwallacea similis]|uniref:angio-associated migratory cell protein n=1 Tax=Euwallacea similis TaxID=1736056 RepID=UPI00344EC2AE